MSQARINASKVSTMLKQGSHLAAVQAVRKVVHIIVSQQLTRAEQDEMKRIVEQGCSLLANNKEIRTLFPLMLQYIPGEEQSLIETLDSLMEALQSDASEEAKKKLAELAELEQYKGAQVAKGCQELNDGLHDEARETFSNLKNSFPQDEDLVHKIASVYMSGGFFEEAANYYDNALRLAPDNVSLLNRLGIALRKMKKFDMAEAKFQAAISINPDDANLHFNLGRVYLEWGKFKEGLESAKKACALNPSFGEANKLGVYLQRKLQNG